MLYLSQIANLLGGDVSNGWIRCPGPRHSPGDRSLSIKPRANALDGYVCKSFADDDPAECREFINAKIGHLLPLNFDHAEIAEEARDQVLTATSEKGLSDATLKIFKGMKPDVIHLYRDASGGGILQAIARWNNVNGQKAIRPFCYTEEGWQCRAHPAPRPLFNLNRIAADTRAEILIVEGEKAAEAATAFFHGVVSTWIGGAKAINKTDFSPLAGRKVRLWPDNDPPGKKAMHQVAQKLQNLGANVRLVDLEALATHRPVGPTLTEGWDAADAVEEGWDIEGLKAAVLLSTVEFVAPVAPVARLQPLPLHPELPPPAPYPVDALGKSLAPVVMAIASKCQVPEAMAAQSVLAVASLAGQSHANVEMPYGQVRPVGVYLVTLASSGDRKSTSDNEALRGVSEYEKILRAKYEADYPDFYAREAAYNAEKRRIETTRKSAYKREDRLRDLKELGAKPEKPLHPIITVADTTLEGLVKNWPDLHAGLGLFSAEGGQFTGGHGMAEENRLRTSAHLSSFWDGTSAKRIRAGDGATLLQGRRLTFHMMLQPQAAAGFLSDPVLRDQGLLSRILVAAPSSLAGTRLHKPVTAEDETAIEAFGATIKRILSIPTPLAEGKRNELEPRSLKLTDDAKKLFYKMSDHIERQMGKDGGLEGLKDVGAKTPENAARIAAILTLIDNTAAQFITAETMSQALKLADWYLGEAARLHEARRTDPQLVIAQDLLDWILASGLRQINQRDIMRSGPKKLRTRAALKPVLTLLVDHHWLTQISNGVYLVAKKEAV